MKKNEFLSTLIEAAGVDPKRILGEDAAVRQAPKDADRHEATSEGAADRGDEMSEADFSTNRRAKFREGWEDNTQDFLQVVGFTMCEYLTKRGYATYGAKARGASLWVKFEGDTSLPYAGGEFVLHINMEHKLSPSLTVKANRGDDKKSGTLKTPSKLSGRNIFNESPEEVAIAIFLAGNPSWGDALGIHL